MNIKELTREQRTEALKALGESAFREKQIFKWITRGAASFDELTDLSKDLRSKLSQNYSWDILKPLLIQTSADGTKKFLLELPDGNTVESVFMQYEYGNSVCLSTQVGCNMGCVFCASGQGGKIRNLKAWEILDEFFVVQREAGPINHVVLMGMGEPFDNYEEVSQFIKLIHDKDGQNLSMRNITVSSCGLVPMIDVFADDFPQANLAISLHAANQADRENLMPIAKRYKLDELIQACRAYVNKTSRRITFEYALIAGKNDTKANANELAALLKGLNCHINLIPLNNVVESGMVGSSKESALSFSKMLEKLGIPCTVRRQLGADIDAACGQLRKKHTCR